MPARRSLRYPDVKPSRFILSYGDGRSTFHNSERVRAIESAGVAAARRKGGSVREPDDASRPHRDVLDAAFVAMRATEPKN